MQKKVFTLFTISPLHVGSGSSVGVVDLPIMRERHTQIPVIPGSSLKGVLADLWSSDNDKTGKKEIVRKSDSDAEFLFGSQSNDKPKAGALHIGEARIILFPVRSLKGGFAWITSSLALSRLARDLQNAPPPPPSPLAEKCLSSAHVRVENSVVLEEYDITSTGDFPSDWATVLKGMLPSEVQSLADGRFVLASEEMFMYFCENACQVTTRIKVDDEKGTVAKGALFSQEQVPSEALFAAVIHGSKPEALKKLSEKIVAPGIESVIQVGGDETTGLGLCRVNLI